MADGNGAPPDQKRAVDHEQKVQADPTAAGGRPVGPDADQVDAERARSLLELAGGYVRQALEVPDELAHLRTLAAEQMFELAMLRLQLGELAARVERLERSAP